MGIISFTDPRSTSFSGEREAFIRESHGELRAFFESSGFDVVDPMDGLRGPDDVIFGIGSMAEVKQAAEILKHGNADCLIMGLWHWTEPELALRIARMCDLPVALYTADDPKWAGAVCISAVGSSMWEIDKPFFRRHFRTRGDKNQLIQWARAQSAANRLLAGTLLMWGGSYCLRMEHLRDDYSALKSYFIGDVITEDQFMLIRRAVDILTDRPERIAAFTKWVEKEGALVEFDGRMLTQEIFDRQVALHLAAIDRLAELRQEDIIGVSIKCQPELSEEYGVTGCFLPSFLPFGFGPEGDKAAVATVCEGDTKGLVTCAMLHALNPAIPPLFGDIKYFNDDAVIISNCGGSSVAWAAGNDDNRALSGVSIKAQCQGKAGGAIGYIGRPGEVTVARLIRIAGEYIMQIGLGESIPINEDIMSRILWGETWPHVAIDFGELFEADSFAKAVGSNHLSATYGDYTTEIEHLCRRFDIPTLRIDDADEMQAFVDDMI